MMDNTGCAQTARTIGAILAQSNLDYFDQLEVLCVCAIAMTLEDGGNRSDIESMAKAIAERIIQTADIFIAAKILIDAEGSIH